MPSSEVARTTWRAAAFVAAAVLGIIGASSDPRAHEEGGAAVSRLEAEGGESGEDKRLELEGGTYDKPHIRRFGRGTVVGGYMDHEFEWTEGKDSTFDQHRFIPFIYSEVSDRIHVSLELEFEHGGLVKGSGTTHGEVKLEYAVLDFKFTEGFNYRGGVILSPLGSFNLLHDSPLNDVTERPTVDRQIIPSTLSESGMGFFGSFYPSEQAVGSYEIYLVNGFNGGVINSKGQLRIRSGRGSQKQDNNNNKAVVGRLGSAPGWA